MTFRIVGFDPDYVFDEKVVAVHTSYDRSMRLWIVTAHNAADDQIGDALFPAGKDYMTREAKHLADKHGVPHTAIKRIDQ